jgi:hypothetical protein
MARYPLTLVDKADFAKTASDVIQYRLRNLMGSETTFKFLNWISKSRLPTGTVCIHRWDEDVLPLYPLLVVATCATCVAERLYLLDNVKPGALEYTALCNHHLIDSKARATFKSLFASSKIPG